MDNLSNFFAILKTGYHMRYKSIRLKNSKIVVQFLKVLYNDGLVLGYSKNPYNRHEILVFLKYTDNRPLFTSITRVSKSSRRVYMNSNMLAKYILNKGLYVISTSNYGVITSDFIVKNNIRCGGEVLAKINF